MKKINLLLVFCFLQLNISLAQEQKLPVLKSNSTTIKVKDKNSTLNIKTLTDNSLNLSSNVESLFYETFATAGDSYNLTFTSNIDSLTLKVKANNKYNFNIKKEEKMYNILVDVKEPSAIQLGKGLSDQTIQQNEVQGFSINLKKNVNYSLFVNQQGIDLRVSIIGPGADDLYDLAGKFSAEKIYFVPKATGNYLITVSPSNAEGNPQTGKYGIICREVPKNLKRLSLKGLYNDFDILRNAYLETRVGLWYNSRVQFDSICNLQRLKIKDKMTGLDFYKIVAPIMVYAKERHCSIRRSNESDIYEKRNSKLMPFLVKILKGKVYIINDFETYKTKGLEILKVNGQDIEVILEKFLSIESSDGFNTTMKYRRIEGEAFAKYFQRYFDNSEVFNLELNNPSNNQKLSYQNVPALNNKGFDDLKKQIATTIPNYNFKESSSINIDENNSTVTITFNTFLLQRYTFKNGREGFQDYLTGIFKTISDKKIKNLIIDIRKNGGGNQGVEDDLLSFLIEKEYQKYKYVEVPSFTYSFLEYTNYKGEKDLLINELKKEFYQETDGRILNLKSAYQGQKPNINSFKGNVYILIGGLSFSGASEFAALAKNHTNAKFIGEETGGGYYGNTSGNYLFVTLPHSDLEVRLPLQKFIVQEKENSGIPFGRGVLPDHEVQPTIDQYLNGFDAEMEFTKKLIAK
jgi:hypothetical protein